ncbi:MAG: lysoplasmalogenase family protein [Clostridiales bacterium]|jgi:hypothetical protein|nr:lysoplasmalogenase family protein [Clostridiales bacterium]
MAADRVIKFALVACAFVTGLCLSRVKKSRDGRLLNLAMFFTLIADYFMVLRGENLPGLAFFNAAQFTYFIRYNPGGKGAALRLLGVLVCLNLFRQTKAPFFIPGVLAVKSLEAALVASYAAGLIANVCDAWRNFRKGGGKEAFLAFLGMFLFFLCDLNVALMNIYSGYPVSRVFDALIWVFYIPSQFVLAVSGSYLKTTAV